MGMRMRSEPKPALLDRERERAALDDLLTDLRSGRGRVLVVRGEAGVGKSALLEYVVGAAAGMRVARAVGGGIGDGAGIRQLASAVRAAAGPAGAAAGSAARRARDRVRAADGRCAGPVPGRPGGADLAVGGSGGAAAVVRGR